MSLPALVCVGCRARGDAGERCEDEEDNQNPDRMVPFCADTLRRVF
jgi:hypothetical protein